MAVLQSSQITGKFAVTGSRDQTLVLKDYDTTQRNSLQAAAGAMIFNNTTSGVEFYTGNAWSSAIGRTGQTGLTGAKGSQGNQGAKGPAGADSNQAGAKGPTGDKGPQGAAGHQGFQGATGPTGNQGPQGPRDGNKGGQGPQGVQGATGPANNQGGAQGIQGAKGPQGAAGHQGFQGATGPAGHQGFQGAGGNQGPKGPQGNQGPQGGGGNQGPRGVSQPSNNLGTAPQGSYVNFTRIGLNVGPTNQGVDARGGNNAAIFSSNNSNSGGGWRQYVNSNPYSWQFRGDQNPGVTLHYWKSNGQFYHKGNISSDQNLKKEITPYTASVLETKLGAKHRASRFIIIGNEVSKSEWTASSTDKAEIGFIAQHYTASAPEVVDMVDTGSLGIQERGVTAMLTKAFQEISESLTNLNNRIKTLEG